MGIDFKSILSLTDFAGRLGNYGTNKPSLVVPEEQRTPTRSLEAQILFDYKKQALEMAKTMAAERERGFREAKAAGLDTGPTPNFKPTMTDYFIAAQTLAETKKEEMATRGVQFTPAVIADLSGHRIDGFQINKSDMAPRREALLLAAQRAKQAAQETGKPPTVTDTLRELQAIQQSNEKLPSLKELEDTMDLDGNATLAFYEVIDGHANFKETIFSNSNFHPAGTLMRDNENGVALTEGASFVGCTFDGMGAEDRLTFEGKKFENITFTNIKGGSITIPDGTQVDGMDIRGAHAELHIGRASVSNLDASGARIVTFTTAEGAEISHSTFNGTTIGMGSTLNGSTWTDVEFNGANLVGVDMKSATLNNVRFNGKSDLSGLDISGAKIKNLFINDELITDVKKLGEFGFILDQKTTLAADPELVRQHAIEAQTRAVADIGSDLLNSMKSIGTATQTAAAPTDPLATIRETMQQQLQTIGNPLTPEEQKNLNAIEEARGHSDNSLSLAPRR